jgi:hypothetical protein
VEIGKPKYDQESCWRVQGLLRNLLISSLEATKRFGQVSGTSDASQTRSGRIGKRKEEPGWAVQNQERG